MSKQSNQRYRKEVQEKNKISNRTLNRTNSSYTGQSSYKDEDEQFNYVNEDFGIPSNLSTDEDTDLE